MVLLTVMPVRGFISQRFGVNSTRDPAYRNSVAFFEYGDYQPAGHNGLDFEADLGEEIYAAHDGWLDHSGDARLMPDHIADRWMHARGAAGWPSGWNALLASPDRRSGTTYSHMVREAPIPDGSFVKAGTVLGWAGSTGRSTGVHCHFEFVAQLPAPHDGWLYGREDPLLHFPAGLLIPLGVGGQGATATTEQLLIEGIDGIVGATS
jgi:murein DD-endopeptidase MepM/ murein hydrolase activator NlpD